MENLPEFDLHRPADVAEAIRLRAGLPEARYLAGGTDMIVNVRRGIETPAALIDLTAIDGLGGVAVEDDGGMRVGALVRLDDLAAAAGGFAAVAEAAASVAGPTHRRYGTVGGNLCLDTRCLYYNQSQWWRESNAFCLKHLGEVCHVAPGGKRCFAAYSGDVAPAMLVHGAEVGLAGPDGARTVPLADLYRDDGRDHLALRDGELLVSVRLARPPDGARSGYAKSRIRGSIDFPLAGVAALVATEDGRLTALRIAVTGVNPYPALVAGTEAFLDRPCDDAVLDGIRDAVRAQAQPMKTTTVQPWYRRRAIGALARRLVQRLATP